MAVTHVKNGSVVRGKDSVWYSLQPGLNVSPFAEVGDILIAWFAFDNLSTTTPTITSIAKPAGETNSWTKLGEYNSPTASGGAGTRGELWGIMISDTTGWQGSSTWSVTGSATVTAVGNLTALFRGATLTPRNPATANSTSVSISANAGDLVLGCAGSETNSTLTGDSDTTNGSWSAILGGATSGGGAAGNLSLGMQWKVPNANGTQSYAASPISDGSMVGVALLAQATVVPDDPTTAPTVAAGSGKVTVTTPALSTSTNAMSFKIYRDGSLIASGIGGASAYDDTAAAVTSTQTYTVRGTNLVGDSTNHSPASSAVAANPGPPSFSLSASSEQISVNVTKPGYNHVVKVYRGPSGGSRTLVHTSSTLTGTGSYVWTDDGLTNGLTYDYHLTADVTAPTSRTSADSGVQSASPALWTSDTGIPTGREMAVCIPYTGGFYAGAGFGATNWLTTAYSYNVSSNSWTSRNTIATYYGITTGVLPNGDAYQFPRDGAGSATVYKYNESTDAWDAQTPDHPQGGGSGWRYTGLGDTIYAITMPPAKNIGDNWFYKWTPGDPSWTQLTYPDGPASGSYADDPWWICAGDDGYIYAQIARGASTTQDAVYRYNTNTDAWSVMSAETPTYISADGPWRSNPINWAGKIYILGVASNTTGGVDLTQTVLWYYDYSADEWTLYSTDMPSDNGSGYHYKNITGVLVDSEPAIYWVGGKNYNLSQWTTANRRQGLPAAPPPPQIDFSGAGTLSLAGEALTGAPLPPPVFQRYHNAGEMDVVSSTQFSTLTVSTTVEVGSFFYLFVAFDNNTATTPTVSSISVPAGETASWVHLLSLDSFTATDGAGARGEMWAINNQTEWVGSKTLTVTLSETGVTKAVALTGEFHNTSTTVAASNVDVGATPWAASASAPEDHLVLGFWTGRGAGAHTTDDTDTTAGDWGFRQNGGANYSGSDYIWGMLQWKVADSTATQTFDVSDGTGAGGGAAILVLEPMPENPPIQGSVALSGSGTLTLSGTPGVTGSVALTGSGTLTGAAQLVATAGAVALAGEGTVTLFAPQQETGTVALAGEGTVELVAAVELAPPTNIQITIISPTQLDLSWDAAPSATGYDIERDDVIIAEYHQGTSYSDTGLTEGTTYTYRVRSQKVVEG